VSIRSTTAAAFNVAAGWLGVPLPTLGKQRSATRVGYRKTSRRRSVPQLLADLVEILPTVEDEERRALHEIARRAE
jgi:hypothetical protein